MTIGNYEEDYARYENMAIWEIKSLADFLDDDAVYQEIFKKEYGFAWSEFPEQKASFTDTPIMVVSRILDYFGDKYFFVFERDNEHHNQLKRLQDKKIVNFGIDIYLMAPGKVFVLMMDKSKNPAAYDTI